MSNILSPMSNILRPERSLPISDTNEPEQPVRWTDINGVKHTTPPGTLRSFALNSREAHEVLCAREDFNPWIRNGALRPDPRWPRKAAEVSMAAESEAGADDAFKSWLRHVEAGRIGPQTRA